MVVVPDKSLQMTPAKADVSSYSLLWHGVPDCSGMPRENRLGLLMDVTVVLPLVYSFSGHYGAPLSDVFFEFVSSTMYWYTR